MLDSETKRRIDSARDILVGKVPDPKSQVEQITIALIYKFMYDMDSVSEELGGERSFFSGKYEHYGWNKLLSPQLSGLEMLNLYSEAIQQMNFNDKIPQLFRDIFKNAYLPYRDPETLKSFLKVINDFEYDHSERLGDAFEYLLSVLGSQGDAGQFRTPRQIIDFMVYLVDPKKGESILDPACGTAGFLISSYKHIVKTNSSNYKSEEDSFQFGNPDGLSYKGENLTNNDRKKLPLSFKGYDISPDMVRLSLVNLYLHGFVQPSIFEYDTLTSEDRWNEHADVILANPPFMSPKGGIRPHKKFSIQSNRSEVLFVDYIIEHLSPKGRAAVIVPEGIIFQSGKAYKSLRKMLVEKYLYAVISLPAGIFNPYSGVKTSILLIDKTISQSTDKILFAKVENDGFDLGAQRRANDRSELPRVAKAIRDYVESVKARNEFDVSSSPNLLIATKEKIAETGDYNLSGERYRDSVKIHNEYKIVSLGNECIFRIESGGTPSSTVDKFWNGDIHWMTLIDLPPNDFITKIKSTKRTISDKGLKNSSAKIIPRNSVIVSTRATIGRVGINEIDLATNQGFKNIIIKDREKADTYYIALLMKSLEKKMNYLATGGTFKELTKSRFSELEIPLPPLEVQREIVAEIEGYQKIIDGARQIIDNYKPQIQIDPSWEMVELGKACDINKSSANPFDLFGDSDFVYIDISSIENGKGIISSRNILNTKNAPSRARRILRAGDILLSTVRPNLQAIAYIEDLKFNTIASTGFAILTSKKSYCSKFIYYSLYQDYLKQQMISKMGKGAYPSINEKDVNELLISAPHFSKQKEIAKKLDKEKSILDANKQLISIFEKKIKDKIASVWGEENLK
jgi:type I restriction enzyme M protein